MSVVCVCVCVGQCVSMGVDVCGGGACMHGTEHDNNYMNMYYFHG